MNLQQIIPSIDKNIPLLVRGGVLSGLASIKHCTPMPFELETDLEDGKYVIMGKSLVLSRSAEKDDKTTLEINESEFLFEFKVSLNFAEQMKVASKFTSKNEDMRPVMNYVGVDGKNIVSTDATVLYCKPHYEEFSALEGNDVVKIHHFFASKLNEGDNIRVYKSKFGLIKALITMNGLKVMISNESKFPNYWAVIPDKSFYKNYFTINKEEVSELNTFGKTFQKELPRVCLKEDGSLQMEAPEYSKELSIQSKIEEKPFPEQDFTLLIMPLSLKDCPSNVVFSFNAYDVKKITEVFNKMEIYYHSENINKPFLVRCVLEKIAPKSIKKLGFDTGLKDSQGKKIHEGSILQEDVVVDGELQQCTTTVFYDKKTCQFVIDCSFEQDKSESYPLWEFVKTSLNLKVIN
jgi:hypothetical protein